MNFTVLASEWWDDRVDEASWISKRLSYCPVQGLTTCGIRQDDMTDCGAGLASDCCVCTTRAALAISAGTFPALT
jgi:hypothetical protein